MNPRALAACLALSLAVSCSSRQEGDDARAGDRDAPRAPAWDAELPPVKLARVPAAPNRVARPPIILTVTPQEVWLDASAVAELVAARSREEPGGADADDDDGPLPLRARHELSTIVDEHAEHPLRFELERLFRAAGFDAREPFTEPLIRLRVDGEARFDSVLHVLASAGYAGFGAYEFEVRTPAGRGQLVYLPYTFCACRLPSSPRWCAVPELRVSSEGVILLATADLTPPPGCHKAMLGVSDEVPAFSAALDWRERVIAGPDGGCPSARFNADGLDHAALIERLRALHEAAPGCGHARLVYASKLPWSMIAGPLSALSGAFGDMRLGTSRTEDLGPLSTEADCGDPLPVSSLAAASERRAGLGGRPGCAARP